MVLIIQALDGNMCILAQHKMVLTAVGWLLRSKSAEINETEDTKMKKIVTKDAIRRLQKDGEYKFSGLNREESRKAAESLANAAMKEDRKNGVQSNFGIARDAFGYYFAAQIN